MVTDPVPDEKNIGETRRVLGSFDDSGANTWMITLDIPGQEESGAMVMLGSVGL